MPRTDEMIEYDAFLRHFAESGGTDESYLRVHHPRFVRTQQRFLGDGDVKGGALLDVGAHWLHQSLLYALRGFDVTALDAGETFRDPHVSRVAERHGIALLTEPDLASARALATVPDDTFDVVLFTEIIEHLAFNPVAMWRQIHRVMKPGAQLIVTTPNYYALRGRAWQWLRFLRGDGSGLRVDAILGEPTFAHHWKEYSLRELRDYFESISRDFQCTAAEHVEKYGPGEQHVAIDRAARLIEWAIPAFRPGLYLQLTLIAKQRGVTIEPQW